MNEIMNIQGIDCYEQDGTAYLKLEAVARGLGFTDTSKGTEYVRWNTVRQYLKDIGLSQEVAKDSFIPENIFYRLAMKAKNETAERFQAFVADEVIPSIRKHGGYIAGQERMSDAELLASALLVAQRTLADREARITALKAENEHQRQVIEDFKPVQQYVDTILSSKSSMTVTQIAADYNLSAKRLNQILYEKHIQRKVNGQWILYREHMGKGYTDSRTINITRANGAPDTKPLTQWTQKGRLMIHNILTELGILAVMDRDAERGIHGLTEEMAV